LDNNVLKLELVDQIGLVWWSISTSQEEFGRISSLVEL